MDKKPSTIIELLDQIEKAANNEKEQVSLNEILDTVGRRSFGPLLLLAGLITLAPLIGDIPGVPAIMGVFVLLAAGQLLLRQQHIWLPRWLLEQSVHKDKIFKGIQWMRKPARFMDRWLRTRLTLFIQGTAVYIIAAVCICIAAVMPAMEVIPFSANVAGVALTAFGLSLITKDGLIALIAFIFSAGTFGLVIYHFI